jgi:hypothetical protein
MQLSPTSRHFISLRAKCAPQHPVLKHPQSMFLPLTTLTELNAHAGVDICLAA